MTREKTIFVERGTILQIKVVPEDSEYGPNATSWNAMQYPGKITMVVIDEHTLEVFDPIVKVKLGMNWFAPVKDETPSDELMPLIRELLGASGDVIPYISTCDSGLPGQRIRNFHNALMEVRNKITETTKD